MTGKNDTKVISGTDVGPDVKRKGKTKGRLARFLGAALAVTLGAGIAAVVAPQEVKETEVYAKAIGDKNEQACDNCNKVLSGDAPAGYTGTLEGVDLGGAVYRGGNSKSQWQPGTGWYNERELDNDPNDFSKPLPYGNTFVDTTKLNWDNPAGFIIDIKDSRFRWVAGADGAKKDYLGNETVTDPAGIGVSLASNTGAAIAYVGELKAFHDDINAPASNSGNPNIIEPEDGAPYLYRITYLDAVTLPNGTRGNLVLTMSKVQIETACSVSEEEPYVIGEGTDDEYSYTKAIVGVQSANQLSVLPSYTDEKGNRVNQQNIVVKTADEVRPMVQAANAAIPAANEKLPEDIWITDKTITNAFGGIYDIDIEVKDAEGNPVSGTISYAAHDMDLVSHQNLWGRAVTGTGADPYKFSEGLAVTSGSLSYAVTPEYNHSQGSKNDQPFSGAAYTTDQEAGWVEHGPYELPEGAVYESPLSVTKIGYGNNADGVRFASRGVLNARDKNGTFENVPFGAGSATAPGQIQTAQGQGLGSDTQIRYKNLSENPINNNTRKLFYYQVKEKFPEVTRWQDVTAAHLWSQDVLGDASWKTSRNDNDASFDTGFAVLLDANKSSLQWSASRHVGGSVNTTLFDSSIYTYVEPTHGAGGGIYIESYKLDNNCETVMNEGTVTLGRGSEITVTAVPEDGYRVERILVGDTNYGYGTSQTGLRNYHAFIIDGNDIKDAAGNVLGSFANDPNSVDITGLNAHEGLKTGKVTLAGYAYAKDETEYAVGDLVIERNPDGTVDVTLPYVDNPMHVHADFDADYYFYKVWKGDSTPEPLNMKAAPGGVYPTEVTIPMPTGEYDYDGEGNATAITEMVTFEINGTNYLALDGTNAGLNFVLSPNNTIEYVEQRIEIDPDTQEEFLVEDFAIRSNVVLYGNEFVHYTYDEATGEMVIGDTYPLTIDTSVADWSSSDAKSFVIDADAAAAAGYVEELDESNEIAPGYKVWKVKYPSRGVTDLNWPALPAERLPKDTAGNENDNHEAGNHTDRYYWFVTEDVPGWSTESYSNEKAVAAGVIKNPEGEDGYYDNSNWAAASLKDEEVAKDLIHEKNEYSYAYMSVFENGGEITNDKSIVVRGKKDWQDDFSNKYGTREDIWLHLDVVIRDPETGSTIPRKDMLPPQKIAANATGNNLAKQWGTKTAYTTGDSTVKVVANTQKVPGNAKLQAVDGSKIYTGPYKYTKSGKTTYYYINELKATDDKGRTYEYSIRETLDYEGNKPVEKDNIDEGLLGYKSEDVADWSELAANEDTYTYKYKYGGQDLTTDMTRYTGTVENKYELVDFTITKKWVDNKEADEHTIDEIKNAVTLYDANGAVDLAALGQSTTNVGTAANPQMEKLGELVVEPVGTEGKEFKLTWKHLPKYIGANGDVAYAGYYVTENNTFTGYTAPMYKNEDEPGTPDVDESEDATKAFNNGIITNAQLINVNVVKIWDDADNQDDLRGDIKVTLFQNGVPYVGDGGTGEVTLAEGDVDEKTKTTVDEDTWVWKNVWADLPYADASGTKYNYTAQETALPKGYGSDDSTKQIILTEWNDEKDTLIFTANNKHDPEKIDFTITKIWDDADNNDGKRPADGEVAYTIKADGTALTADELAAATITGGTVDGTTIKTKTTGTDGATVTVEGLPKNKKAGQEITYTIEETAIDGYTATIPGDQTSGFTVKNVYTPETVNIDVKKVWEDDSNRDGKRTAEVTFRLFADDEDTGKTVVVSSEDTSNEWVKEEAFKDLPKYKAGQEIVYTIKEDWSQELATAGYEKDESEGNEDGEYTITNTYTPATGSIVVKKIWDDNNNQDGKRPTELKITLKSDDKTPLPQELTLTGNGNEWTSEEVKDLPIYKTGEVGKKLTYTIEEAAVTGYTAAYDPKSIELEENSTAAAELTVTNKYTPEKVNIPVKKVWDDNNNQDGKRPGNVIFNLVIDGVITDIARILNDGNKWTATFEALDKYKEGKEIAYTVIEALKDDLEAAGYTVGDAEGSVEDGFTITNKYTPETITVRATKVWDDNDDQYGLRKDAEFTLKADTSEVTIEDATKTISKDATGDALTVEWEVPKYNDGKEVNYTVSEGNVSPYSREITGDMVNGFTVTNTYPPTTETTEVTRTITYKYIDENGEEASATVTQKVKLQRVPKVIDEEGGVVEWSDWEIVEGETDEVDSPGITGWTPDRNVDEWTVEYDDNGDPMDAFEEVYYTPQPPVGTPDETYGGKGESQTGTPTFEVSTPKTPDGSDNEIVKIELLDENGNPTDTVEVPEGTYKLNDDGTITFTPNDPEYVGDPTPVNVRGTDKNGLSADTTYTPHIVDNTDTVKRTITYEYSDGTPVLDDNGDPLVKEEEVTFTGTVDPKTGEVTYPDEEKEKSFPEVDSPDKDGWTPDHDPVDEDKVKPGDDDIEILVIYNPSDLTADPDETWGLRGEPQTGEPVFNMLTPTATDGTPNEIVSRKLIDPSTGDPAEGDSVTIPGQGTYTLNDDGRTITFTPEPDFVGNPTPIGVTGTDKNGKTAKTTYTPHVVDPSDEGTATRTIHYTYLTKDGTEVTGDTVQTTKLTRKAKSVDPKTGDVLEWDDWTPDELPAVENPDKEAGEGWSTTDKVDALEVTEPGDKGTEYVVYKPEKPEGTPDETYGLKDQPQTGEPTFEVTTKKMPDGSDNEIVEVKLLDADGNPTDTVEVPEGTYKLNDDGTITFTPKEGFVGDPTPVNVRGTDKFGETADTTYTPHVVDPEDKGEATRTIHYTYRTRDGEEVTEDTKQSVELTRKAIAVDPKTGEVTEWGPWEKAELPDVTNPDDEAGEGWSTTDKVDKLEVTEPGDKGTEYVVYQPEKPEGTPDETWGGKNEPQTGTPDFEVTTPKMPDGSDNEIVEVKLLDKDGNPTDTVEVPEGTYKLNDDGTITFTPKEDFVGDPTPVNVRGTDKLGGTADTTYTPHVVDNTDTVKRTITYEYSDGTPVLDENGDPLVKEEEVTFTGTVDPETGKVTFPDETKSFPEVDSPDKDGWTPDHDPVKEDKVKPGDDDITRKVIYSPEPMIPTPDETWGLKGEPQTGKPDFDTPGEITDVKLIDPQTGDPVDEVTIPGQGTYKLNEDGTVTFTPEPDFVGNPSPVGVIGKDSLGNTAKTTYTPHVVDPEDKDKATRTIHYTYLTEDGEEVTEDTKQTVELTRKAKTVDPKTGGVTEWGPWEKATFPAIENPDDKATKDDLYWTTDDVVDELEVTEPGDKGTEYVVYQPSDEPVDPVDPYEETTTVTRKIEYKYYDENGNEASKTITQTVELKRTAKKVDPDTGEVTEWNDWTIVDNKDNKTVESPEIEGWDPDRDSVPPMEIDLTKEDPQEGIEDELVVYTPQPPEGTPKKTFGKIGKPQSTDAKKLFEVTTPTTDEKDENGNPIPNEIVKIELIDPETGEPAKTTTDPETGKTIYGPVPAYGIDPETGERTQIGTYELDPETGIVTFRPNETFTGTPEPARLKATDKNGLSAETIYTPSIPDKRERVTVDREITYMYKNADGTETPVLDENGEPVKVIQTVTFTRETNVDPETGALEWTEWVPEKAVMKEVVSPTEDNTDAESGQKATNLEGWTPDKDVDEFEVTIDPETNKPFEPADDVVYYICGPVGSDKETWGAPGEQQKGTPKFKEGTGKITGYELMDPDPDNKNKKTVPGEGTYELNPETGEVTFTPEDGFTGKGEGVTVKATDENGKTAEGKYVPNVPEPDKQTGKRTIEYLYDDGTPVLDDNGEPLVKEQPVEFTRTPTKVDPETGEVLEWSAWEEETFPDEKSPEVDGYTPNKDEVPETPAKPGDDKHEVVIYKKTSEDPTKTTETRTVKRTIHYRYLTKDGEVADKDVEQTVTFTREKVTSPDGEVTYTEWSVVSGDKDFAEVVSPDKTNYDVDRDKVDAVSVTPDTADMEEWVIYTPVDEPSGEIKPPVGSDKETWGGRGQKQSDTPEFTKGTGKIPEKGAYSLENPDEDDPLTKTIPGEGKYTLDPDTGKVTFEPEDDFIGDGTGVTVKVTDENGLTATGNYTPHVVDNVQEATAKRTIEYYYNNGEKVPEDLAPTVEQTTHFYRTGVVDPKSGKITRWNDWTPYDADSVDSPDVPGYKPNVESVDGITMNPGDNIKDLVIYVPENHIIKETQTKTVTRIIKYRYLNKDGEEAFADVKQTVTFSRIMTTNTETGETSTSSWIPADEVMEAVDSPLPDNYTVDRESVDEITIDPNAYENGAVIEEYVIYTPKTIWVTYVDEDGKTIYLEKTTEPKAAKGQKQEEPDAPDDPKKDGFVFKGWDREVDPEGNITYTARWEPEEKPEPPVEETIWVTYVDPDGVTIYLEKTTMPKGDPQEEPEAPEDPKKDGAIFAGWDREVDPEGNITYTARWRPVDPDPEGKTYWVTYVDPDGKTIYLEKTTQPVGEAEPEAPADPKKDGFVFDGWDREVDPDGNVTYTAKWIPVGTDPTDPTDPTEPTDPTDPTEPTDPSAPADPTEPGKTTPGGSVVPGGSSSQGGRVVPGSAGSRGVVAGTSAKASSPGTGDSNNVMIWVIAAIAAAGAGITAVVVRRRKRD